MENFQLPEGNGQTIYINPEDFYIKPEWINGELKTITMPDIPIEESNVVYETYKYFFKCLYELGYKVETDSRKVNDDAFFFTPCLDQHINKTKEEYKTKKDNKIVTCLNMQTRNE